MTEAYVAAIDLGTNTARLLIGTCNRAGIEQHLLLRRITRLGGGFSKSHGISAAAQERTLAALQEFAAALRECRVKTVRAVATSAVRDAANGREFCERIRQATGITLEVIDGETEGLLTLRGVRAGLDEVPEHLMVFDIGGGSTEYTMTRKEKVLFTRSLPLGVVRLTEGKGTPAAIGEKVDRELASLKREMHAGGFLPQPGGTTLVGTAGTATNLAAISMKMTDYDYRRVNNYQLSLDEVRCIYETLLPMTPAQRLLVPGMEKGREDLIVAGTLITIKTMEIFALPLLKVSDFGLLQGILLNGCNAAT